MHVSVIKDTWGVSPVSPRALVGKLKETLYILPTFCALKTKEKDAYQT